MTVCREFETRGARELERGTPLSEHFQTCADCMAALRAYQHLGQLIAKNHGAHEPPAHWETRVLAAIDELDRTSATRSRRRAWLLALAPAAVLAAAAVIFLLRSGPSTQPDSKALALTIEVRSGTGIVRSQNIRPGDRLRVSATLPRPIPDSSHVELRIYRDDSELIVRCSDAPPCTRQGTAIRTELILPAPGSYQILLMYAPTPLPAPSSPSSLDVAIGQVRSLGGDIALEELQVW